MSSPDGILGHFTSLVRNAIGTGSSYPTIMQRSTIDGREYRVRDLPDKQQAANLLARLRLNLGTLMDNLVQSYPSKSQVVRLQQNFQADPSRFYESTPDAEHTSYSVNKGESVHFCLRQRDGTETLVDGNVMMFVALHEMAHMITQSVGHEAEFWNNFGWLLREAEQRNMYSPTDFKAHPVAYCGVSITDAPKYNPAKDEDGTNLQIGTMTKTNKR
jgi:predicted metal-dependent hydrolase